MFDVRRGVATVDPEIAAVLAAEARRQEEHLELIASENHASPAVLAAQGSVLTNKYAEGYPGRRYYGGCEHVDVAERIAIERACALFGAGHANVQPHSGSTANAAAYMATMKPGDTLLGMRLADGGHLTHGARPSFSGKTYHAVHYGVDPTTGLIDYDEVERAAREHRPAVIVAGFSAYSRVLDFARFRAIADAVEARLVVDMAHVAGLVAADLYPSPVPHADVVTTTTHKTLRGPRGGMILAREGTDLARRIDSAVFPGEQGGPLMHVIAAKAVALAEAATPEFRAYQARVLANARAMAAAFVERGLAVVSGGTDNHLMLVDLRAQGVTGAEAEDWLGAAHLTVNKNAVPGDPQPPTVTSGLRVGTPAATTRGLGEAEMRTVAHWICDLVEARGESTVVGRVRDSVRDLCAAYPVYGQDGAPPR
ncbi:MAG: serine hydroxymethyltransferase [Ectothiorhodospiraceae bacterium]|nr:serine hydroxymethyltransferase [Chromatiales bacterium]MCP5155503.1 serine hydroxymethyltransferase [Ectothiorhodospiraceae bacterium]